MNYRKVDGRIVAELKTIVGAKHVWTDPEKMEPYSHDAVTGDKHISYPEAVVLPATTEEVAADGNVHADVLKEDLPQAEWDDKLPKLQDELYTFIYGLGGKLSGEHGIGF